MIKHITKNIVIDLHELDFLESTYALKFSRCKIVPRFQIRWENAEIPFGCDFMTVSIFVEIFFYSND